MAAGKVRKLRRPDFSDCYRVKNNVDCGKKREFFESDVKIKGNESMEVIEGIITSNLQKKRKFSPVLRDDEIEKFNLDDGEIEEIDFEGAIDVSTSRWAKINNDLVGCAKEKAKSSSPESGITQKDDEDDCNDVVRRSLSSEIGNKDGCSISGVEIDVSMEVDERGGNRVFESCRSVRDEYDNVGKISEGAYGVVYKARGKKSKELVALKKMKLGNQKEGFPVNFLREINILLSFNHPSIVNVREVMLDESGYGLGDVYLVMDYVEHDLQALMDVRKRRFSQSEVKCLMLQLLEGVKYLHDNWVMHRDLKTSNLLYNNQGELKICDFGMSRNYGSALKPYTELVVTLWYRAPELLLGAKKYSEAVDMWSVGCIMAELLTNKPLFEGKNEVDQLDKIFRKLGTPNEKIWPGYSELPGVKCNFVHQPYNLLWKEFPRASFTCSPTLSDSGLDLLSRLLTYDPEKRITAQEALNHCWFEEVPLATSKEFMPTFPAAPRAL